LLLVACGARSVGVVLGLAMRLSSERSNYVWCLFWLFPAFWGWGLLTFYFADPERANAASFLLLRRFVF